jgi:glutamate dehydrogenase
MRDEYATQLAAHPLRQEIVINAVVNSMVNRGGITFAFRAGEETGADPEQVARAFVVCREVFGLSSYVAELEALDNVVSTETQTTLYLEFRRLLDRAARWFLSTRPTNIDVVAEVERFRAPVAQFAPRVGELLQGSERRRLERRTKELEKLGVPAATATRAASLLDLFSLLDVIDLAEELELPVDEVAGVYYYASEKFTIDEMLTRVSRLPRDDRWDALARGAMRDDLYAVLESLTRSVLVASDGGDAPGKRFEYWADANRDALKRAKAALHGVERLDNAGLAALSVALRTLRSVLRAGQPA